MKVLRSGGAYLEAREWWAWTGLAVVALAVFLAAIQLLSLHRGPPVVFAAALLAAAFVAAMAKRATPKLIKRLQATRKGRLGERLTTQLVARLSDDYYLINDIGTTNGNIDHVIVGPCGILVLETKRVGGDITVKATTGQ